MNTTNRTQTQKMNKVRIARESMPSSVYKTNEASPFFKADDHAAHEEETLRKQEIALSFLYGIEPVEEAKYVLEFNKYIYGVCHDTLKGVMDKLEKTKRAQIEELIKMEDERERIFVVRNEFADVIRRMNEEYYGIRDEKLETIIKYLNFYNQEHHLEEKE